MKMNELQLCTAQMNCENIIFREKKTDTKDYIHVDSVQSSKTNKAKLLFEDACMHETLSRTANKQLLEKVREVKCCREERAKSGEDHMGASGSWECFVF